METYFAPPERAPKDVFGSEVRIVGDSAIFSALLQSVSGLLAVMNEQRQILALNDAFLRTLGIDDPEEALGLRLGEALRCIHADDVPAGCGTTRFCSTCGAAIAIVVSSDHNAPEERLCALTARRHGKEVNIALLVRSQPVVIDGNRFLLLLVHDVTVEQRRAALERTFFHDVNNLLTVLVQACETLAATSHDELAGTIYDTALQLHREVAIQQYLSSVDTGKYRPVWRTTSVGQIVRRLGRFFYEHPAAEARQVEIRAPDPDLDLTTDVSALSRVLNNMVTNALEATDAGDTVRMWVESQDGDLVFCVWNRAAIPDEVGRRLFQCNYSTKAEAGRGIGTFSMKLLGEDVLGGQVDFTSSESEGTVFRLRHPVGKQDTAPDA